ncbi:hypothetical protein C1T31_00930 [Hanstruepera neustonica]|uniref:Uncharacterized protein n=1 Tax=Hanstruepera neustonica TaxID=1445657 RepID=A0A2K1E399_9FLAO|nr:hypothetical protein C1T31_00930 [Hanstruepera neustonica]
MINKTEYRIILSSLICVGCVFLLKSNLEYTTITFGLIMGLSNFQTIKINKVLGVVLCVLFSFLSFLIAFLSFGLFSSDMSLINQDLANVLSLLISAYIIAPVSLLILYSFIFNYGNFKTKKVYITLSIILLLVVGYLIPYFKVFEKNIVIFSIWQITMSFVIHIVLGKRTPKRNRQWF